MEFTEFQRLTHEIGTAILVLLYALRLVVLFRRRLARDIADLKQSPRAIERLAREELGLARPDETVFLIREEDPDLRP